MRSLAPVAAALFAAALLALSLAAPAAAESDAKANQAAAGPPVEFNRDIRPILSNHCFQCHGPDAEHREAGLRFDIEEVAKSELESGLRAIVAGDAGASELVARLHSDDEYVVMPPPETNKPLTDEQKELLERWIAQGAPYEAHWSLTPLERPDVPEGSGDVRIANPIDAFVAQRLERERTNAAPEIAAALVQSPPADQATLLRRVSFDLTGLPPTPEQTAAFLADGSPDAYSRAVDRLLESPDYGEHMARFWLDLVRYADTHGMHFDNYREMWPYRDYIIRAFNENKPLDAFYTEQLAGDLMNGGRPTLEQQVASGFNRLNVTTNEGGSIYDEVFIRNVADRTEAFGTVFLGMTTGCAVCHDHKFDPISQQEFYELSAFFNSLDGRAMDSNRKDHEPVVRVPDDASAARIRQADEALRQAAAAFTAPDETLDAAMEQWAISLADPPTDEQAFVPPQWQPVTPSEATSDGRETTLTITPASDSDGLPLVVVSDGSPQKIDYTVTATLPPGTYRGLQLVCVADPETDRVGRSPNGNVVISEIEAAVVGKDGQEGQIRFASATADHEQDGSEFAAANVIDAKTDANTGWALAGHQKTGGRTLTLTTDASTPIESSKDEPITLRVTIRQQSKFGQHALARFGLQVSEQPPAASAPVVQTAWHAIGPFEADNVRQGVRRKYAGEMGAFDPAKTVNYRGQEFAWAERPTLSDGLPHKLDGLDDLSSVTLLHRTIVSPIAQTVTAVLATTDGYRLSLNGKEIAKREEPRRIDRLGETVALPLKAGENSLYLKVAHSDLNGPSEFLFAIRSPDTIPAGTLLRIAQSPERSADDAAALRRFHRRIVADVPAARRLNDALAAARTQRADAVKSVPTTLVWKELDQPRQAHILLRGEYDQKGDPVNRDVPDALPAFPDDAPRDRLGLAKWLLQPGHPLTARVAANRFWQQVFGQGLVRTSEDFGGQGETPSHPLLLDWLASELATDWDVKRLMRLIVTSETYRQSSRVDAATLAADPKNRLLARGPRYRLDAESLRDQALAVSGLLNTRRGGPSVKPPQPGGLWKAVAFVGSDTGDFKPSEGDDIYRRSVYIFWKRTAHAPMMATFDAPPRESCTARRERTNTPLQALLLMNEQLYVEAARALAADLLAASSDDARRLRIGLERVTGRPATDPEIAELTGLLADVRTLLAEQPEQAKRLIGPAAGRDDDADLAAFTIIANTLLNLDEVVTKS